MPIIDDCTILSICFLILSNNIRFGFIYFSGSISEKVVGEPLRANRLFWAFALCLLPFSLMLVGGERALEVLKTASILASVPLIVIFIFMMISFLIILGRDRIKLETRAEKLKEVERRSLRIVQVSEEEQDDNL
ncbi:BCCT family transporter [Staphylococcus aureus]|nr:BCCT family transporter [Staphylococcus aureus]